MLEQYFWGNRVLDYLTFLAIFVVGLVVVQIFKTIILNRLKVWSEKTKTTIDDFVVKIFENNLVPLAYFGVFYSALGYLTLIPTVRRAVNVLGVVALTVFAIRLIIELMDYVLLTIWLGKEEEGKSEKKASLKGILNIAKIIVWGLGIVFLLDNLGFKISAVIAGLGIGGIAVALAAQAVLGDLFSYFAIFFDRPFEVGDFIIVGDYLGAVEHVGIKTTRIRSLSGEQLVFSNTDLTNSRVRNYKRMEKRRVVFKLGVTYQTALVQLKEIPEIITKTIKNVKDTVFDRAHFFSYGDFALIFEVVYYVLGNDYNKYMDIQQEINFKIKEEFEKRGIEFAYPTQTVFIEKGAN